VVFDADFQEVTLRELIENLLRDGFQPYTTSVGGSGLGVLSPYHQRRQGPATPPDSPPHQADGQSGPRDNLLRGAFETKNLAELSAWADGCGRWLYV
jgi:hypothetical protein